MNIEAIRAKLKKISDGRGGAGGGVSFWFPEVGEYTIRCVAWPDAAPGSTFHELSFNYFGKDKVLAPSQFGDPDPIKEERDKLFATKDPEDNKLAKMLIPKFRTYVAMFERGKEREGIKVWSIGKTVHARLLSFFLDSDIGDFLDPQTGFDLKVSVTRVQGKKFNDTTVDVARKQSPMLPTQAAIDALLKTMPNIKSHYEIKSYDECKRRMQKWLSDGAPTDQSDGTERGGDDAAEATADDKQSPQTEEKRSDARSGKPQAAATSKKIEELEKLFSDDDNG